MSVQVNVARIGRAHGIRGDFFVSLLTDEPKRRFAKGAVFTIADQPENKLELTSARQQNGKWVLHIAGIDDRNLAEQLTGKILTVEVDEDEKPSGDDEYYDRQLIGLIVCDQNSQIIGEVVDIWHSTAQDIFVIKPDSNIQTDQNPLSLPFVKELIYQLDLDNKQLVLNSRGIGAIGLEGSIN